MTGPEDPGAVPVTLSSGPVIDLVADPVAPTGPEPDPEMVAAAALGCAGVHQLSRGDEIAEIATYLPGRRVYGVRVSPGHAEVHIVAMYDVNVAEVAAAVRLAIRTAAGDPPPSVDVYVDDVLAPGDGSDPPADEGRP